MKRPLWLCVCAVLFIALLVSSCSNVLPIRYAAAKTGPDIPPLPNTANGTGPHTDPAPAKSSPKPGAPQEEPPLGEPDDDMPSASEEEEPWDGPDTEPTPNVDEAIEKTDESLSGGESPVISDFSVTQNLASAGESDADLTAFGHYLGENDARYRAFIGAFPGLSAATALALVNVNADYGYYNGITLIEDPGALLVLCNKNFQLPSDFAPQNLRKIAGSDLKMDDEAAAAFEDMRQTLKDELGLPLVPASAYRDFSYQKALYARYARSDGAAVADTYSARAGHSEHQTGLTLDFLHKPASGSLRSANFQNTEQYAWLLQNAHRFGYILRYPKGDESITGYVFEPWHWRYIGAEDATRMFEAGITTFEEYIGTYYRQPDGSTPVYAEAG